MKVYCDNGSTSFPKAPGLGRIMGEHIDNFGINISRGGYSEAFSLEAKVIATRKLLADMFNCPNIKNIIFTPGATWGLNMVIAGLLKPGDRVISSSIEHNAVVRPLANLAKQGLDWAIVKANTQGELALKDIEDLLNKPTKAVVLNHASNVSGSIMPLEQIGRLCNKKGAFFIVDAAQSAGSEAIDMQAAHIDALIMPGHKSLLGPQGIGAILLSDKLAKELNPLILGGTGSLSDKEWMPDFLPDKFQPGTMNIPGIIGLNHSLNYILEQGIEQIKSHKQALNEAFVEKVGNIEQVKLIGYQAQKNRSAVISLDFSQIIDNAEMAYTLEQDHGILTRCGLHCAPHAHQTFGSYPNGTVRFSWGYFNTLKEVDYVATAIMQALS